MKQRNIVDVLYIALGKVRVERELLAEEMKRVQRLSLGLRYGRDFRVARELSKPDEIPMTRYELANAGRIGDRFLHKSYRLPYWRLTLSGVLGVAGWWNMRGRGVHFFLASFSNTSMSHGLDRVWIKSGLFSASSL